MKCNAWDQGKTACLRVTGNEKSGIAGLMTEDTDQAIIVHPSGNRIEEMWRDPVGRYDAGLFPLDLDPLADWWEDRLVDLRRAGKVVTEIHDAFEGYTRYIEFKQRGLLDAFNAPPLSGPIEMVDGFDQTILPPIGQWV